ncbi:MAG: L-seryl-tRNA(Sec) selenium transferase [Verrucomicrobiae bacterium]|nr:L-seryl-tRNA(Sec) selenium transferase [Verrucomicrobiae bacterium]
MPATRPHSLRKIPAVEILLRDFAKRHPQHGIPRQVLANMARSTADEIRNELKNGALQAAGTEALQDVILQRLQSRAQTAARPHYCRAINATGIILHTGLGRAPLPETAIRQIHEELRGYSRLQQDPGSGKRSRRDEGIENLLRQLTGAEAATVVNNNAAATLLVLSALAKDREVIVSRGQLIEIGGEFRLPDVMAASGARLVEVGTTNRTHPRDYEQAITASTAAIMRVHPSNFRISGFTAETPSAELVRLAHARGILMIDDVGAGALLDFSRFGFAREPTLMESVRSGADVILSSADKLIGGPQGGLILGKANLLAAIRKHPLARILRVGKLTLAALEATLRLFLDEETAFQTPTLRLLRRSLPEISSLAERIVQAVHKALGKKTLSLQDGFSQMGGGSLPEQNLPTRLVAVHSTRLGPDEIAARLRAGNPPLFARIHENQVLLDPRTLLDGDEPEVVAALIAALQPAHA